MTRNERIDISFTCALVADLTIALISFWARPPSGSHHWYGFLGWGALMLIGVIPGWLVFLVLVLLGGDLSGWEKVPFFFAGSAIGPVYSA